MQYLLNLSFEKSLFPEDLKIAKTIQNNTELSNYRLISVLPCFSKILTQFKHSPQKQFGFQEGQSTDHAILQLVDQIRNIFVQNNFTLGVFIDLSKAFHTVDHNILLIKLGINGIVRMSLKWFKNHLNNREQYIRINNEEKTNLLLVKCAVPQGSILGPLTFLLFTLMIFRLFLMS